MVLTRCLRCEGAGELDYADATVSSARPELNVGQPVRVECPDCAGRGWIETTVSS